jgi:hypothetical protein
MAIYDDRDAMERVREAETRGNGTFFLALAIVLLFVGLFALYRYQSAWNDVGRQPAVTRDGAPAATPAPPTPVPPAPQPQPQ